ncbi:hypothetical protein D3C86_1898090 [compost metagenome]
MDYAFPDFLCFRFAVQHCEKSVVIDGLNQFSKRRYRLRRRAIAAPNAVDRVPQVITFLRLHLELVEDAKCGLFPRNLELDALTSVEDC